jgi:hypothetical protein
MGRGKMSSVVGNIPRVGVVLAEPLMLLTPEQVLQVDRALASIGPFGEVRLVKVKGQLRFIQKLDSRDLLRGNEGSRGK